MSAAARKTNHIDEPTSARPEAKRAGVAGPSRGPGGLSVTRASSVLPCGSRARRDALVRELAPGTIRTLVIELTPARAAALDVFEITTGRSAKEMILDFLDDEIFAVRS